MLAQNLDTIQSTGLSGAKIPTSIGELISNVLPYVFGAAALMLLIYLVMGGLQLMTSRGDPKGVQMAQAKITNALIGFVIIFFSYILVNIIARIFGVNAIITIFGTVPMGRIMNQ
ncbi:MAG TPA: hypothetical protein VKC53_00510 [Patescibacteria group bacterium]|nr:hypothetical protein [Patescibacteria group bacterium]